MNTRRPGIEEPWTSDALTTFAVSGYPGGFVMLLRATTNVPRGERALYASPASRRRRRLRAMLVALVAVTTVGGSVSPAVAQTRLEPPGSTGPELIDPDAVAALTWTVPERYSATLGPGQYEEVYDPSYVTPRGWSINFDACASRAVRRIERYTIVVTRENYRRTLDGKACRFSLHHVLPSLGLYRVEVVVHTALGASPTLRTNVELRDYLIVSIGDSLSSGESVPDWPGSYTVDANPFTGEIHSATAVHPVVWTDRRCHRSPRSGPSLAAKAIEDASRHSSVTFVSFACSGAEIANLVNQDYAGSERGPLPPLQPQVSAVRDLVGDREITALLITAGINDLHFADIIDACASNDNRRVGHTDCVTGFAASGIVNTKLPGRYDKLAAAIAKRLPRVREVYIADYPSRVFANGGCGALGFPGVGIDRAEGEEMRTLGGFLDTQINHAARRHRDQHWNYVEGLTEPFDPHPYACERGTNTWFTTYEGSWAHQGNEKGTAHPNRAGHRAFARLLGRAVVPNQATTPFRQVTVVIDALRWRASSDGSPRTVEITMYEFPRDFIGTTRTVSIPQTGEWIPVPAGVGTFTIPLFLAPASPRHATQIYFSLSNILPIHHTVGDSYGVGSHEFAGRRLAVRYHVSAVDLAPPLSP